MARDGSEGEKNLLTKIQILQDFSFLKKAAISLNISLMSKASAEIPPFPPLKKGGGGGAKKANSKS
jgi:hypothetical protein